MDGEELPEGMAVFQSDIRSRAEMDGGLAFGGDGKAARTTELRPSWNRRSEPLEQTNRTSKDRARVTVLFSC